MWTALRSPLPTIRLAPDAGEPARYARDQLAHYLKRMLGGAERAEDGGASIELRVDAASGLSEEGYRFTASDGALRVIAGGDLGLVFGVFGLLRRLGCRFSSPGPDGEHVPTLERLEVSHLDRDIEPLMPYRAIQFAYHEPLERDVDVLDWMVRNGLNYVTYRLAPEGEDPPIEIDPQSGRPIGDAGERPGRMTAEYFDRCLLPEVSRRGLKLDFGHHNLLYWVPPAGHLKTRPEWYALRDGVRGKSLVQLALCMSEPAVVEEIIANARAYLRAHPDVGILGIIPEDGIGMCQCDRCVAGDAEPDAAFRAYKGHLAPGAFNPSKARRYADLLNTVARALRDEFPRTLVGGAAYADLQWPAEGVAYEPNVTVWLAVYWRDGARTLLGPDASACNRLFADLIVRWRERIGDRLSLYEYYMGMNAQSSLPYPMTRVLIRDWADLRRLGLSGATVQCFAGVHRAYALNMLAFARCGWETDGAFESILDEYLEGEFGAAGPALRPIFEALEDAAGELARLVPGEAAGGPPEIPTGVLQPDLINVGYFVRRVGVGAIERCLKDARRLAETPRERRQLARFEHYVAYVRMASDRVAARGVADAAEFPPLEPLLDHIRAPLSEGWIARTHATNWRRFYDRYAPKRDASVAGATARA